MVFCGESSICSQPRKKVADTFEDPGATMCRYCSNCGI